MVDHALPGTERKVMRSDPPKVESNALPDRRLHSAARVIILITVVLLPWGERDTIGFGTAQANVLLLLSLASVGGLLLACGELRPSWSPVLAGAGVLVVSGLVSTYVAVDPAQAVISNVVALLGLGLATAIVLTHQSPRHLRLLLEVGVFSFAAVAAWSLRDLSSVTAVYGGGQIRGRLSGPLTDPNQLGALMAWTLPGAFAAAVTATNRRRRLILGAACAVMIVALAFSFSRGSWMGCAAAFASLWVLLPERRRALTYFTAVASGVLATLWLVPSTAGLLGVLGDRLRTGTDPGSNPEDDRPAIWAEALDQINDRPLLGSGSYGYTTLARYGGDEEFGIYEPAHAHSLYLSVTAERGIIGLLALVTVMFCCFYVARRTARLPAAPVSRTVAAAATAGLVAVAVQGIIDQLLGSPIMSALSWLLLGMLAAGACVAERESKDVTTALAMTYTGQDSRQVGAVTDPRPGSSIRTPITPRMWRRWLALGTGAVAALLVLAGGVTWVQLVPSQFTALSVFSMRPASGAEHSVDLAIAAHEYSNRVLSPPILSAAAATTGQSEEELRRSTAVWVEKDSAIVRIQVTNSSSSAVVQAANDLANRVAAEGRTDGLVDVKVVSLATAKSTGVLPPRRLLVAVTVVLSVVAGLLIWYTLGRERRHSTSRERS